MLTLDTDGSLKKVTGGAYQGQAESLILGENYIKLGPNYIGSSIYEDSLEMTALFDPDISAKTIVKNERIGYVQMAELLFNDIPVPIQYYDAGYQGLELGNYFPQLPSISSYKFTDAPDNAAKMPYFAYWESFYDNTMPEANLYRFPRQYGALTKRPLPDHPANGLSKVGHINMFIDMNLRSLPGVYSIGDFMQDYINEGDFAYDLITIDQKLNSPNQLLSWLMDKGKIPQWGNIFDKSFSYIHAEGNYQYIVYDSYHSYYGKYPYYLLIFPEPINQKSTYALALLSEDLRELATEEIINGEPDFKQIQKDLRENYKINLPNADSFKITFRFLTYPCTITPRPPDQMFVATLKPYEGFKWEVSRLYDKGWRAVTSKAPVLASESDNDTFYIKLNKFFSKYFPKPFYPLELSWDRD